MGIESVLELQRKEIEALAIENEKYREENKTLKNECYICHRMDEANTERDVLREALKETTMLFRYMLEPESVINLHHCDEMDKLTAINVK